MDRNKWIFFITSVEFVTLMVPHILSSCSKHDQLPIKTLTCSPNSTHVVNRTKVLQSLSQSCFHIILWTFILTETLHKCLKELTQSCSHITLWSFILTETLHQCLKELTPSACSHLLPQLPPGVHVLLLFTFTLDLKFTNEANSFQGFFHIG